MEKPFLKNFGMITLQGQTQMPKKKNQMSKPDYDIRELRFGNFLLFNGHTISRVFEINGTELTVNGLSALDDDMYDAIDITEEWLKKLGFEDVTRNSPYGHPSFAIGDFAIRRITPEKNDYMILKVPSRIIKYVHQLQNVYFSLTGNELLETKGQ
jgi:hypothetical protein